MDERIWHVDTQEASQMIGCDRRHIYYLVDNGFLTPANVGQKGKMKFRAIDVSEFRNQNKKPKFRKSKSV